MTKIMANTQKVDIFLQQLFEQSPLPDGLNRNEKSRFNKGEMFEHSKIRIYEQFNKEYEVHLVPKRRTAQNHQSFKEPINQPVT